MRTMLIAAGLALAPGLALADAGSANCAVITQAAAQGAAARIQADDTDIKAPASVTTLSCLDGFFNGIGLNVVASLLDPTALLNSVEGKLCALATSTWKSLTGSAQCGLTITGFDLGFGGFGGGTYCPKLSFGGGGPTWASFGAGGASSGGSGLFVNGSSLGPTSYTIPSSTGGY